MKGIFSTGSASGLGSAAGFSNAGITVAVSAPPPTIFRSFAGESGIGNLPQNITINSQTVSPSFRYEAKDATTSAWSATVGTNLTIGSTGSAPSVGLDTPFTADTDKNVRYAAAKAHQASTTATGDISNEDIIFECIFDLRAAETSKTIVGKRGATGAGWAFGTGSSSGRIQFLISDGTNSASILFISTVLSGWNHYVAMVDRSENSTAGMAHYLNGVAISGTANPSAVLSLSNAKNLTIGADSDFGTATLQGVAYTAIYAQNNLFAGGAQNAIDWLALANIRSALCQGVFPSTALGTAAPLNTTRNSGAALDKINTSTNIRSLFNVGSNWMRYVRRKSKTGVVVKGALAETTSRINLALQSEAFDDAAWTKTNGAISPNIGATPFGTTTADVFVGAAGSAIHGVQQTITLTAATYTWSTWVSASAQSIIYLQNSTIANGNCWFNLSSKTILTQQAGIIDAIIEDWGNGLIRIGIKFTGTAASHTLVIAGASADNTTTYTADGISNDFTLFGAQCMTGDSVSSYVATTTAAITRASDVLNYVASDGNVANSSAGTLSFDVLMGNIDCTAGVFLAGVATTAGVNGPNSVNIGVAAAGDVMSARMEAAAGAGTQFNTSGATDIADGEKHNLKASWDINAGKLIVDGVQEANDTSVAFWTTPPNVIYIMGAGSADAIISNLTISNAAV